MKKLALVLLLIFGLCSPSYAAITRVQGDHSTESSTPATTKAVTLGAAIGSGNTICGIVSWDLTGGITLTSVQDDKGNTYNLETAVDDATNGQRQVAYSRTNITNGPTVFTANFSASIGFSSIIAEEFSGTSTSTTDERDGSAHGGQLQSAAPITTDGITSGNFTTAINGDLIYGATIKTGGFGNPGQGTGFTPGVLPGGSTYPDYGASTEYRVQTTAGSGTAATFTTGSSSAFVTFMIAIKPAGAPPPPSGQTRRSLTGAGN